MMLYSEEYYRKCAEEQERRQRRVENALFALGTIALLVALFCAWWFAPAFARADEIEEDEMPEYLKEMYVMCQPDSYVNIRARANKHSQEEGRLYVGDMVLVDRQHGAWSHCVGLACEAGEGWVKTEFLDDWEPELFREGTKMVTVKDNVNARYSLNGKRRKLLRKGSKVTVWAISEDWAVTSQGMIMADLLGAVE